MNAPKTMLTEQEQDVARYHMRRGNRYADQARTGDVEAWWRARWHLHCALEMVTAETWPAKYREVRIAQNELDMLGSINA